MKSFLTAPFAPDPGCPGRRRRRQRLLAVPLLFASCGDGGGSGDSAPETADEATSSVDVDDGEVDSDDEDGKNGADGSTTSADSSGTAQDDGTGTTTAAEEPPYLDCGWSTLPLFDGPAHGVVVADFDGDGDQDIITSSHPYQTETLTLWTSATDALAFRPADIRMAEKVIVQSMSVADIDGLPGPELFSWTRTDVDPGFEYPLQSESYFFAGPSLPDPVVTPLGEGGIGAFVTHVGDVDDDGAADFLMQSGYPARVEVWRGAGDGTFELAHDLEMYGCYVSDVVAVDANGDGFMDLVSVGGCNSGYEDPPLYFHAGNGNGFADAVEAGATLGMDIGLSVGRFDDDELDDILVQGTSNSIYTVATGDGQGNFTERWSYSVEPSHASAISVEDIDGDGRNDVLARARSYAVWLRSTGDSFDPCVLGEGWPLGAFDVDGTGLLDVLVDRDDAIDMLTAP